MTKLTRLYMMFLLTGLLLLISCMIISNRALHFNIHSMYFGVAYLHIGVLFFLIYGLYSLVYLLIHRYQNYVLGLLHLVFVTPLFIHVVLATFFFRAGATRGYVERGDIDSAFFTPFAVSIYVFAVLFMLGQLLFLANIILSIVNAIRRWTGN